MPGLRNATAFVLVESNLGNEAHHHRNYLRAQRIRNIVIMEEDRGRVGFRTDNRAKHTMAMATNELVRRNQIRFHRDMVVCDQKKTAEDLRNTLTRQLRSFMRIVHPAKNPWQNAKIFYHGKFGPNRDDLVITLMLNVEGHQRIASDLDGKYEQYKVA